MTNAHDTIDSPTEAGTSRFLRTPKWQLHYNECGEGTPMILLHGSGPGATGWSNFSPNIPHLARRHRVIALDLPGWGKSDPLDPLAEHRQPAQALAVRALMDGLGLDKASLVGNSMGGGVAMQVAVDNPDRISRCVTMGAGIFPGPGVANIMSPAGLTEGLRIIVETYRDPSPENFRRLVNIMVYDPSFVTDELLAQRSQSALANRAHLANFLKPFDAGHGYIRMAPGAGELNSRFAQMQTPCLFIHGRDDRVVNMESSLRAVAVVPNASMHLVNRCGHWTQLEHAALFNRLVGMFLESAEEAGIADAFGG